MVMRFRSDFVSAFDISDELKEVIKSEFGKGFEDGLHDDPNVYKYSPVKMLPTYISVFPDGAHQGCFASIDFGGTNLRFVMITLDSGDFTTEYISSHIPEHLKDGDAKTLFDYIAQCLEEGLSAFNVAHEKISFVGFTFSFPCAQNALNHGTLIKWTKLFKTSGVVGRDVVNLLAQSCSERGLDIENFCLLNDTTGTLLCGSFEDRKTFIGMINGTGTNACYLEKTANVKRINMSEVSDDTVIINTEWGSLGDKGALKSILTEYDEILDEQSLNRGQQRFEKCVSGLYLPEIARIFIVKENDRLGILNKLPSELLSPYSIDGSFLSLINDFSEFKNQFKAKFNYSISNREFWMVHRVFTKIVHRASVLTALALSQLMERVDSHEISIAADGSLCRKHPNYLLDVSQELKTHTDKKFLINTVDDGSGKGSALAACIATIKRTNNYN